MGGVATKTVPLVASLFFQNCNQTIGVMASAIRLFDTIGIIQNSTMPRFQRVWI